MPSGLSVSSRRRGAARETHAFFAERWQSEPGVARELRQQATAYLSRLAVSSEHLARYRACWDASTAIDGHSPLPCPQCFSRHILSPLKGLGSSLSTGPVACSKCGVTLTLGASLAVD